MLNLKLNAKDTVIETQLLIVGGGASGTTAAVQAARMGIRTIIIEETEWLGGMLTSAGVSAIDGNHNMPSGLWGEFRQKLYNYYGGPREVETGWVSNTLFEPSVGNKLLKELAVVPDLTIYYKTKWISVKKSGTKWLCEIERNHKSLTVKADVIIDATELGDVLAYLKVPYRIGMDSRFDTKEEFAPEKANNIIQDLTYVVTLKDYGKGANKTIAKPEGYRAEEFRCSCDIADPSSDDGPQNDCYKMLQYGRLPNNKYMINWPKCGNDIYLNIIENTPAERESALKEAKLHALRFVYYIQTELGYRNLGLADEYPTKDKLPMLPYHRESRRVLGLVTLTLNHVARPYEQPDPLYRTGIAVGDYTIDHHHLKNPSAPLIEFVKIKVPSYNVPLGSLIPAGTDGLIVAEKSISVSNIVNGATRLQPVVLGIGQAAGALAAVAIKTNTSPSEINIRAVQQALLDSKAYLMPFVDIKPDDKDFAVIQRIGATGILKGTGIPYKWANQTWFYPERTLSEYELITGLRTYYPELNTFQASGKDLTIDFFTEVMKTLKPGFNYNILLSDWEKLATGKALSPALNIDRRTAAILIDHYLNPFLIPLNFDGTVRK